MNSSKSPGKNQNKCTVFLDAAGTLIKPLESVSGTYSRIARDFGVNLETKKLSERFSAAFTSMPDLAFSFETEAQLHQQEYRWWYRLVAQVIYRDELDFNRFDDYFDRLYSYYAKGDAWKTYSEVKHVLQQLSDSGASAIVVSNFDSRLENILKDLKLDRYLDRIVYSSRAGYAKPNPGIFQLALEYADTDSSRVIHVGDSESADYWGARSAGIDCLLLDRGPDMRSRQSHCITDLKELLRYLSIG